MELFPLIPDEAVVGELQRPDTSNLDLTMLRVHAVGLNFWLNRYFTIREGYPVPVIWAKPMDAFSQFDQLWNSQNNPFRYLSEAYEAVPGAPKVYPVIPRYPLISVDFRGMANAPLRSYGSRVYRRIGYPTVEPANLPGVTLSDIGWVQQARMPLALDLRYQIDHWCLRPDTQSYYIEQVLERFKNSASVLQAYVHMLYPKYFGHWLVKMYVTGDISDLTEKDPTDNITKYHTSYNVIVEGWRSDSVVRVTPTLWSISRSFSAYDPAQLNELYVLNTVDYRPYQRNPTVILRAGMPPGTVVGSVIQGTVGL